MQTHYANHLVWMGCSRGEPVYGCRVGRSVGVVNGYVSAYSRAARGLHERDNTIQGYGIMRGMPVIIDAGLRHVNRSFYDRWRCRCATGKFVVSHNHMAEWSRDGSTTPYMTDQRPLTGFQRQKRKAIAAFRFVRYVRCCGFGLASRDETLNCSTGLSHPLAPRRRRRADHPR